MKHTLMVCAMILAALSSQGREYTPTDKLRHAEAWISQYYVDSISEAKLAEDAIRGMLKELDPHSAYSTPEETKDLNEPLQGNFSGIGISFNMNRDTLYVVETISGGPSERVGLLPGDRIISVNDSSIAGVKMSNKDIMKRLRGPKGTNVNVRVLRKNLSSSDTIDFRITRAEIPIYSVDCHYMVDPKTGYIRIRNFAAKTPQEVYEALENLQSKGLENLILDLTDNGGGYLNAAADILGELLPPGKLTVFTQGRATPSYSYHSTPLGSKPLFDKGRLVIMTNQYSASASEITAGAIQDWDRGVIVGRRTFGKGLVQKPFLFPDGSMMRLTIAHYYTPSGRDIQKPFVKGDEDSYRNDIKERFDNGELMHVDSIHYDEKLRYRTLVNKRNIYGGGGIYPDKFVALDTIAYTKYYRDIMAKGLLNQFAIKYVDEHRDELKSKYKDDDDYVKEFCVSPNMLAKLYDMAADDGITYDEDQAKQSEELTGMVLKALIGRDVFNNGTYFKVYNKYDPIFKTAYDIINSKQYDSLLRNK